MLLPPLVQPLSRSYVQLVPADVHENGENSRTGRGAPRPGFLTLVVPRLDRRQSRSGWHSWRRVLLNKCGFQPSSRQLQISTPFIDCLGFVHPPEALIGRCAVIFGGHGALPLLAGAPRKLYSGYGGSGPCVRVDGSGRSDPLRPTPSLMVLFLMRLPSRPTAQ